MQCFQSHSLQLQAMAKPRFVPFGPEAWPSGTDPVEGLRLKNVCHGKKQNLQVLFNNVRQQASL